MQEAGANTIVEIISEPTRMSATLTDNETEAIENRDLA